MDNEKTDTNDGFGSGMLFGAWLGAALVAIIGMLWTGWSIDRFGTLSNCRAANPGYDCSWGWIKSDEFK